MSHLATKENPGAGTPGLQGQTKNQRDENIKAMPVEQLLQREALQELGVALAGWGYLAARAAYVAPADEVLGVFRGARKTLLAALDEAKALAEIEGAQ